MGRNFRVGRICTVPLFLLLCSLQPCSSFVKFHPSPVRVGTGNTVSSRRPLRVPQTAASPSELRRKLTCRLNQNRNALRMSEDVGDDSDMPSMKQLQARVAELKTKIEAEDEQLKFNWRGGLMSSDPVVVIDDWIRGSCFHGDTVAVGTYSGMVIVVDTRSGDLLHVLPGHDGMGMGSRRLSNGAILSEIYDQGIGPVTMIDWDGENLVSGGTDGAVLHWIVEPGKPKSFSGSLMQHEDVVTAVKLSSHSSLWSSCLDGFVRSWRRSPEDGSWNCDVQLNVGKPVLSLACSQDWMVAGAADGTIVLFEVMSKKGMIAAREVARWAAHEAPVRAIALGGREGEERVYSGCHGSWRIKVWDLPEVTRQSGEEKEEEGQGEEGEARFGVRMYDEFAINQGRMLQTTDHFPLATMRGHQGPIVALAPVEEHGLLFSAAHDGTVRAWDLKSEECLYALGGHTAYLTSLQVDRYRMVVDGTNNVLVQHSFKDRDPSGDPKGRSSDPEDSDV